MTSPFTIELLPVYVLLGSLLSLVILLKLIHVRFKKNNQKRLALGLSWLHEFRLLLTVIQQHRGLSNGYLCGDHALLDRITPLQVNINQQNRQLITACSWLQNNPNWQGIDSHWQRLSAGFKQLSSENNLEQHNKLITNLLYLIDDCAEQHRLYEIKDDQQRSIRYLWQELLVTAENIGQARALGTGVAASGSCSSVERIRLSYLHQAINSTPNPEPKTDAAINDLLELIRTKIIVDKPSVNAKFYFDAATVALETVLQQFDAKLEDQKSMAK